MTTLSERWIGSTTPPVECFQRGATVRTETETITTTCGTLLGTQSVVHPVHRRRYITYTFEKGGQQFEVVDMPDDAPTKSCNTGRHDQCSHRLGAPAEGGILLKGGLPGFLWRCGCACHRDPSATGMLF